MSSTGRGCSRHRHRGNLLRSGRRRRRVGAGDGRLRRADAQWASADDTRDAVDQRGRVGRAHHGRLRTSSMPNPPEKPPARPAPGGAGTSTTSPTSGDVESRPTRSSSSPRPWPGQRCLSRGGAVGAVGLLLMAMVGSGQADDGLFRPGACSSPPRSLGGAGTSVVGRPGGRHLVCVAAHRRRCLQRARRLCRCWRPRAPAG